MQILPRVTRIDVEVAGADTSQGDAYQSILRVFQLRNGFLQQGEFAVFDIGIG